MKKSMIAAVTLIAFAGLSFAQAPAATPAAAPRMETPKAVKSAAVKKHAPKAETMMGEITAIDTVKNEITVKDKKTAVEKSIGVDAKKIAGFKVGDDVKVTTRGEKTDVKAIKKHEAKKASAKKVEAPK